MSSSNGISKDALQNSGTAQGMANAYSNRATANSNILTPTLNSMATDPQGYGQQQMGNFNTAATQAVGGATAGAVGGGNQAAARTNNAGGYAPAAAAAAHDATSQLSDAALNVQNQNAQQKQQQQQEGLSGLENMYGTNTGAGENALGLSNSALGVANTAKATAMAPWIAGIQAAGQIGGAFCPAEGSLYLMADGTEKPVESLEVGDQIMGIDDEPQTIEEIQKIVAPVVRATTEDGFVARNSFTHAYAMPRGGFVVAGKSRGKSVATKNGASRVVDIVPDGEGLVFNVITDGSHTYRADGIWSVGVGDAERHVEMSTWIRLGNHIGVDAHV